MLHLVITGLSNLIKSYEFFHFALFGFEVKDSMCERIYEAERPSNVGSQSNNI